MNKGNGLAIGILAQLAIALSIVNLTTGEQTGVTAAIILLSAAIVGNVLSMICLYSEVYSEEKEHELIREAQSCNSNFNARGALFYAEQLHGYLMRTNPSRIEQVLECIDARPYGSYWRIKR